MSSLSIFCSAPHTATLGSVRNYMPPFLIWAYNCCLVGCPSPPPTHILLLCVRFLTLLCFVGKTCSLVHQKRLNFTISLIFHNFDQLFLSYCVDMSSTLSLAAQLITLYIRTLNVNNWHQIPRHEQQELLDAFVGASLRMLGIYIHPKFSIVCVF